MPPDTSSIRRVAVGDTEFVVRAGTHDGWRMFVLLKLKRARLPA